MMRILFLTIGSVYNFDSSGVYIDLLKRFATEGHEVYVVGAIERRIGRETQETVEHGINVLRVRTGNITKTNLIEKGISTLTIGRQYEKAIFRYWKDITFDLIIYTTPPITIAGLVKKIKRKYNARTYLLLKDIFPQNAVDIGILSMKGWKRLVYQYFRVVEKRLYKVSDRIGCMSQANLDYVLSHNKEVSAEKVEICPNTIDVIEEETYVRNNDILKKYGIPSDKYLLLYGGNFGKPQNVDFLVDAIDACSEIKNVHFVLCGSGTDFWKIKNYVEKKQPSHVSLVDHLPYGEYAQLVRACSVGLLFLDYRFTIPNFPSRLLDYMNFGLPVIAATDVNTDVGRVIVDGGFGWWVESRDKNEFAKLIQAVFESSDVENVLSMKSRNSKAVLRQEYETGRAYSIILDSH